MDGGFPMTRVHHHGECQWMKDFMESLDDVKVEL